VAVTFNAVAISIAEVIFSALVTLGTRSIITTIETSTMSKIGIVDTLACFSVAVALFTLICILTCCKGPWFIIKKGLTSFTVFSFSVVLAGTDSVHPIAGRLEAIFCMAVAFAITTDSDF